MIKLLLNDGAAPHTAEASEGWTLPEGVIWVDLFDPTREEEQAVEKALGLSLPTREEMSEIETSSRLYRESGAVFMTASVLAKADEDTPVVGPVTFVLSRGVLITIRYIDPGPFRFFHRQVERDPASCAAGPGVFLSLFDAIIDRLADVLEHAATEVESVSARVFRRPEKINFRRIMDRLGKAHGVNSKVRESASSLMRTLIYAGGAEGMDAPAMREHISSLQHDLHSLTDHSGYVAGNITFLLDAALGLINIEQNAIIKIFSVAAVVFLPPTLVASYFGMNFRHMPELDWTAGEFFALGLMIASVIAPLWWFRKKRWL